MITRNLIHNLDDGLGKIVDRTLYRREDIFERHAERVEMQKIGSSTLCVIIPGYAITQMVKYAWNVPNLTKRQRGIYLANSVAAGLTVEAVRAGTWYLIYELWKYTHK